MMRGFDSIESMNNEELLVKRKRGSKKYLLFLAGLCAVCFVIGVLVGYFSHPEDGSSGDSTAPSTAGNSFNFTKFILDNVDKDRIRESLRNFTGEPRLAGTVQDDALAKIIAEIWTENGLEGVHLATYDILLSFPNKTDANLIQIVNTTSGDIQFESRADETPLTPAENNSHIVPSYNAYSPAGNVTGALVYVNYGRFEDFEYLATNFSINFAGLIVVARYGKIFRGDKVRNAERFNASAIILYTDPADFNRMEGTDQPYPHSWWLPDTGMQRGTIYVGNGDPQTPLYPSTYYSYRLSPEDVETLPKIPCQPIGYGDARQILKGLGGPAVPEDWKGDLNFTYHIGPGYADGSDMHVRLVVNNYLEVKPVHNVIGYIKGSEEPDRYVLLGNHHDTWVLGAVDPLSGTAALTEVTRVFGQMLQEGHRPRRTLVFCSWDGEESGLMGSVEWVEDNLKLLQQRGVALLNMDYAVDGNYSVAVGTSPLLQDALYTAARKVPSPDTSVGASLYDLWKQRPVGEVPPGSEDPYVTYSLGSGSDMAAFYQRAGVSSIDLWMTYDQMKLPILSYPVYHSSYETFYAYETFIDPGFIFTKAATQMLAILASDFANAEILPFRVERYSEAVDNFHKSLMDSFQQRWQDKGVSVDAFKSAVANFSVATKNFQHRLDSNKKLQNNSVYVRMVNDQLMFLERAFLDPEGLPGLPDQKHVMFAPSQFDSYKDNSFPGIVDTMHKIDHGEDQWELLKQQVYVATYIIQSAATTLDVVGL